MKIGKDYSVVDTENKNVKPILTWSKKTSIDKIRWFISYVLLNTILIKTTVIKVILCDVYWLKQLKPYLTKKNYLEICK